MEAKKQANTIAQTENFKKIKKNIYGKLQSAKIIFPVGFQEIALHEVKNILNDLWFSQATECEVIVDNHEIIIHQLHMFAIIELMLRSHVLTDVRLILLQSKVHGKTSFQTKCQLVPWSYYLSPSMIVKIKVDSIASKAFHEGALKEILIEIIKPYVKQIPQEETAKISTSLYAEIYKDKLQLSISLAGDFLYKRGYRKTLQAAAPLREDMAASCLKQVLQWAQTVDPDYLPKIVLLPFSGTGTFMLEFMQLYYHISTALLERLYALQMMPLFRAEHFQFLLKKSKEVCQKNMIFDFVCIDQAELANTMCLENMAMFNEKMAKLQLPTVTPRIITNDFLQLDLCLLAIENNMDILLPMNPPYGIRLGKPNVTQHFYQKIALKVNQLAEITNNKILGFILCPTEESWSTFLQALKNAKTTTYHFMQGGMDIRVCQFYIKR